MSEDLSKVAQASARILCIGRPRVVADLFTPRVTDTGWRTTPGRGFHGRSAEAFGSIGQDGEAPEDQTMNTVPSPTTLVPNASYDTTRFNALRHGVLSRHT